MNQKAKKDQFRSRSQTLRMIMPEKTEARYRTFCTNGWHIVSMKDDWKTIFPFEMKK